MPRNNFTKKTQRLARERSGMLCEAVGAWYGLDPSKRCNAPLSAGVQFDHIDLDANSKDNSLENCAAVCIKCHSHKTAHRDIPIAAKTLRQQDAANGVKRAKQPIPQRPKEVRAASKITLPPRAIYRTESPARPSIRQESSSHE